MTTTTVTKQRKKCMGCKDIGTTALARHSCKKGRVITTKTLSKPYEI